MEGDHLELFLAAATQDSKKGDPILESLGMIERVKVVSKIAIVTGKVVLNCDVKL